jgi:hypothetical protein
MFIPIFFSKLRIKSINMGEAVIKKVVSNFSGFVYKILLVKEII